MNGSIRESTLRELFESKMEKDTDNKLNEATLKSGHGLSYSEGFKIWEIIFSVANDAKVLKRLVVEMIEDHCLENVRYLEIRSTPKKLEEGFEKKDYIEKVLEGIKEGTELCEKKYGWSPLVKYLVSINRTETAEEAMKSVQLAAKYHREGLPSPAVVGVEIGGDPSKGNVERDFIPALKKAKEEALKIAVHIAEIKDTDQENGILLALEPHRLGHAICLNEEHKQIVISKKIPIEMCLTSNTVFYDSKPEEHHMDFYFKKNHPISLCCDDRGVFQTTCSKEFLIAANAFQLSKKQLAQITMESIEQCFIGEEDKKSLRETFTRMLKELL